MLTQEKETGEVKVAEVILTTSLTKCQLYKNMGASTIYLMCLRHGKDLLFFYFYFHPRQLLCYNHILSQEVTK